MQYNIHIHISSNSLRLYSTNIYSHQIPNPQKDRQVIPFIFRISTHKMKLNWHLSKMQEEEVEIDRVPQHKIPLQAAKEEEAETPIEKLTQVVQEKD